MAGMRGKLKSKHQEQLSDPAERGEPEMDRRCKAFFTL